MPSKKYSSSYKFVLHNLQNIDFPYNLGQSLWKGSTVVLLHLLSVAAIGGPCPKETGNCCPTLHLVQKGLVASFGKKYLRNKKEFLIICGGLVSIMYFSVPSLFLRSFFS